MIDVDGPEGRASLKALIKANERLPETVIVITPNGKHIYFKAPVYGVRIRFRASPRASM